MRMAALQTEADDYVGRHRGERDEMGCALVVRNGRAQARKLTLGGGRWSCGRRGSTTADAMMRVAASALVAASCRPTCAARLSVAEVLPILYLWGFPRAIFALRSKGCWARMRPGLSPTNIAQLTACSEKEYMAFRPPDLTGREHVYAKRALAASQSALRSRYIISCRARLARGRSRWGSLSSTLPSCGTRRSLAGLGPDFARCGPKPQRAIAHGNGRRGHPAPLELAQQRLPALRALPVAVLDCEQLPLAVGPRADHDQRYRAGRPRAGC